MFTTNAYCKKQIDRFNQVCAHEFWPTKLNHFYGHKQILVPNSLDNQKKKKWHKRSDDEKFRIESNLTHIESNFDAIWWNQKIRFKFLWQFICKKKIC